MGFKDDKNGINTYHVGKLRDFYKTETKSKGKKSINNTKVDTITLNKIKKLMDGIVKSENEIIALNKALCKNFIKANKKNIVGSIIEMKFNDCTNHYYMNVKSLTYDEQKLGIFFHGTVLMTYNDSSSIFENESWGYNPASNNLKILSMNEMKDKFVKENTETFNKLKKKLLKENLDSYKKRNKTLEKFFEKV